MIIKSHIRGGYRSAADYLKDIGQNEKTRLVEISDPDAKDLHEAFHNMWTVAANSKVKKPLHHISINPFKDERLTDEQVMKIVARCEEKYGYKPCDHQRVIVEHIKDGRQHFHVMWCRVSLKTGKAVWPGHHWKKSKQAAREMEGELGPKRPTPRRVKRMRAAIVSLGKLRLNFNHHDLAIRSIMFNPKPAVHPTPEKLPEPFRPVQDKKGWPDAAILDWKVWGSKESSRFFRKWPELMPDGFVLTGKPGQG